MVRVARQLLRRSVRTRCGRRQPPASRCGRRQGCRSARRCRRRRSPSGAASACLVGGQGGCRQPRPRAEAGAVRSNVCAALPRCWRRRPHWAGSASDPAQSGSRCAGRHCGPVTGHVARRIDVGARTNCGTADQAEVHWQVRLVQRPGFAQGLQFVYVHAAPDGHFNGPVQRRQDPIGHPSSVCEHDPINCRGWGRQQSSARSGASEIVSTNLSRRARPNSTACHGWRDRRRLEGMPYTIGTHSNRRLMTRVRSIQRTQSMCAAGDFIKRTQPGTAKRL